MASTRKWRCGAAIRRNQTRSSAELFRADVLNGLPRSPLGTTAWQANGEAISRSREADQFLRAHGFDRFGRPDGRGGRS